jgi:hypothetical protein
MDIREIGWKGVHWFHLVQDRDQWRALLKTASINSGNFMTNRGLCFMELVG